MDMLTFSKDRQPELTRADLNETVSDVIELVKQRADEAKVMLVWQPRAELPPLQFDTELLHRAVLNVVGNAIDACEKRPEARVEVSIEWAAGDAFVRIVVADNGEGIAAEEVQRIFSVFESKKGARGTGLGLPVSQKIMREHGGEIRVESTPGAGSRFYLELPIHSPQPPQNSATIVMPTVS
jgi:signal transduction histidine kinase